MVRSSQNDGDQDEVVLPPKLLHLRARALAAGLTAEAATGWDDDVNLRVYYPEGAETRPILYDAEDADRLEHIDLATVRFLPHSHGYVNTATGHIELQVRVRHMRSLQQIPGYERLGETVDANEDEEDLIGFKPDREWRLAVQRDSVTMELSPLSADFRAIRGMSPTLQLTHVSLKIDGARHSSTEDTLRTMRTLSDAFLFDLDVRYGLIVEEWSLPHRILGVRRRKVESPALFPANQYPAQPISLYRYGQSAQGLPLLSFLAFYQVLEFFFPIFTQENVTRQVQQTLRNPRFDASDDQSILKLVEAIRPSMRFGVPEREQLRAAIRRCLDVETIRAFVTNSTQLQDHFCKRQQSIPGLRPLKLEGGDSDLRDQVADRIYDIRCRIVHTKSDGGDAGIELLLPSGPEARTLAPDIDLVRLAAQEALVAGASRLRRTWQPPS